MSIEFPGTAVQTVPGTYKALAGLGLEWMPNQNTGSCCLRISEHDFSIWYCIQSSIPVDRNHNAAVWDVDLCSRCGICGPVVVMPWFSILRPCSRGCDLP